MGTTYRMVEVLPSTVALVGEAAGAPAHVHALVVQGFDRRWRAQLTAIGRSVLAGRGPGVDLVAAFEGESYPAPQQALEAIRVLRESFRRRPVEPVCAACGVRDPTRLRDKDDAWFCELCWARGVSRFGRLFVEVAHEGVRR